MRLTRLLLPLYLPSGKPAAQHARTVRFLSLLAESGHAARSLLAHAPKFVTSVAGVGANAPQSTLELLRSLSERSPSSRAAHGASLI